MNITFVTGNKNKVQEAEKILNIPLEIADIDLDEIQEIDLEKVAAHKIDQAYRKVKKPVIIDDGGVYIRAWNNFPGPLIKWILKVDNNSPRMLLKMLEGEKERSVTVKLAIGFHDRKNHHLFFSEVQGQIAKEARGKNGFGWDSVFILKGHTKTYAEMSLDEKNEISHRKIALGKLRDFLIDSYDI